MTLKGRFYIVFNALACNWLTSATWRKCTNQSSVRCVNVLENVVLLGTAVTHRGQPCAVLSPAGFLRWIYTYYDMSHCSGWTTAPATTGSPVDTSPTRRPSRQPSFPFTTPPISVITGQWRVHVRADAIFPCVYDGLVDQCLSCRACTSIGWLTFNGHVYPWRLLVAQMFTPEDYL